MTITEPWLLRNTLSVYSGLILFTDGPVIPHCSPREISKINWIHAKVPGQDLITAPLLQELPRKGLLLLTNMYNAVFRLEHVPSQRKLAKVMMIPKVGKPPVDPELYRPISLLPTIAKIFEKVLMRRLLPTAYEGNIISEHQFGFRADYSTIKQVSS